MEIIGKLIVPTLVIISIISIGIVVYIQERSDARHHLKDKENKNEYN